MKNEMFIPTSISDADANLVIDYAYYCEDKINMNEMPFTFEEWQQANYDMAD